MIRFAEYTDIDEIYELIKPYHEESVNELTETPYDIDVVYNFLDYSVPTTLVYVKYSKIVGVLIFTEVPMWWANDYYFSDVLFYIKPEYRGGLIGGRLIKTLTDIGKAEGKVVQLAGLNGKEGVNNAYNKRFTNIGSVYLTRG